MGEMTKERLIAFESRVAAAFLDRQILAPIHLSGGNEDSLIEIFKDVRDQDWVCSTWRSHYHALLKGIPEEQLFADILAKRSMHISSAKHRFLSSSIMGGMLPIACGLAMGIQRRGGNEKVWVFIGDMCSRAGVHSEFSRYAVGHNLPVKIVVEDNGMSTNTPTDETWGMCWPGQLGFHHYEYERVYAHVGCGQWVNFS